VVLNGNATAGQDKEVTAFFDQVRKAVKDGQMLFDVKNEESLRLNTGPGGALLWSFSMELKRTEAP
jgi:mevalonate pyrophosphate decarboxylase